MKQRIITGLLGVLALAGILALGEIAVTVAVVAVIVVALIELMNSIGLKKEKALYVNNLIFAVILYAVALNRTEYITQAVFIYVISLFCVMVFTNGRVKFEDAALCFMSMAYVLFFLIHLVFIRKTELGLFNLILVLLGAVATDTFAYFTGITIGKHKLCPKMSPKKTIEGALGGVAGAVLVFVIYGYILKNAFGVNVNFVMLALLGVICAIFSQIGDLAASVIKRQMGIKDYGKLLPGHGGIMDRVDSISFVAPLVFYFVTAFQLFA